VPPAGVPPAGVLPAGVPPAGVPPAGVLPGGVPPAGALPGGVLPGGVPPAGGAGTVVSGDPAAAGPAGKVRIPSGAARSATMPLISSRGGGVAQAVTVPAHKAAAVAPAPALASHVLGCMRCRPVGLIKIEASLSGRPAGRQTGAASAPR
jgi:hypothetical protein